MDFLPGLPRRGQCDVQIFGPNAPTSTGGTEDGGAIWRKKPGAGMVAIFAIGAGGSGGHGVVGAVSTAGSGAGGGSGAQIYCEFPALLVPDVLYVMVGHGGIAPAGTGGRSVVSITPGGYGVQNNIIVEAKGGLGGGSGSGGGGGSGGTGGAVAAIGNMPLCPGVFAAYGGQSGASGTGTGAGNAVIIPVTGLRVTGGASGAGLNGSGVAGSQGGSLTVAGYFPAHNGGAGGSAATTPPGGGNTGYQVLPNAQFGYWYGGTGGGSSHGSATGAGLFGGKGGDGGIGSGGGGGGGALTGSTQGLGGRGGDGLVIIAQW